MSFWLHMIGIPACFVAAPAMLVGRQWLLAGGFFVGGYALQFIGHVVEGNRSGEEMLLRRIFRQPASEAKGAGDEASRGSGQAQP